MIDPRKSISREEQDKDGVLSTIKSLGVLGVAALGGVRLTNSYTQMYRYVNKTIDNHKAELASKDKQLALLYNEIDGNMSPGDRDEVLKYMLSSDRMSAVEGIPVHDHLTGTAKERALYSIEEELADLNREWTKQDTRGINIDLSPGDEVYHMNLENVQDRLDKMNQPLVPKVMGKMAQETSIVMKQIEKAYPGFNAFMNEMEDVTVKARPGLHGWNMKLSDDIGKTVNFFLPDHTSGFITVKGVQYRHIPRIIIPGDVTNFVESFDFGAQIMQKANSSIEGYKAAYLDRTKEALTGLGTEESVAIRKKIFREMLKGVRNTVGTDITTSSKAELIKTLFERTISTHTDEYIGDVHPASTLIKRFVLPELEEAGEKSYLQTSQTKIAEILQRVTGKKVRIKGIAGNQWKGNLELMVPSTSESATLKGKISTKSPFFTSPFMDYGKQSQQRIDWMRGKPIKGSNLDYSHIKATLDPRDFAKRMSIRLAALLGPAPIDMIEELTQLTGEAFPGKMANVGFWFNEWSDAPSKELSRVGDGAVIFVARETSPISGTSTLNIEDFAGTSPRTYDLLSKVDQSGNIHTSSKLQDTIKDIDAEIKKNGVAELKKGKTIGFDPVSHKEVKLAEDSIVMKLTEKDGEMSMIVREKRPLTVGQKFTLGKAQITKIVHPKDIEEMMGGSFGKYLAAGDSRVGVELLMDSDLLSRYKGGGVGLGIMQKVLNDMALVERNNLTDVIKKGIKKEIETGIVSADVKKAKESISKKMMSVARYMLGNEAVSKGIETITVDEEFNVAVMLQKGVTTDDAMFFRLSEVEKLIEKGEVYNDWTGLVKWADDLESNVKRIGKISNFKVRDDVNEYTRMVKGDQPSPVFLMTSTGKDAKLAHLMMRAPSLLHKESAYQSFKVATRHRTPIGYSGGFKMTIDHIRNASIMGIDHYSRYLQILRDYNVPYIQNKYSAAEAKPMQNLSFHKKTAMTIPTDSGPTFKSKTKELILSDTMIDRLAQDYADVESLHGVIKFKVTEQNSSNLIGEIGNDRFQEALLNGEFMDLDDITARGKLGLRGNSLGLTDKETMRQLMMAVNDRANDEIMYMKLPADITIDGTPARYVPLHDFNAGDLFELTALDKQGQFRASYFTGNNVYQNQIRFMREMANIDYQMRQSNKSESQMKEWRAKIETHYKSYLSNLKRAFTSKNSPIQKKITQYRMPVSAIGKLRNIDEHMLSSMDMLKGKLGGRGTVAQVAMHVDSVAEMLTMGEVSSFDELRRLSDLSLWYDEYGETFKNFSSIIDAADNRAGNWSAKNKKDILNALSRTKGKVNKTSILGAIEKLEEITGKSKDDKFSQLMDAASSGELEKTFKQTGGSIEEHGRLLRKLGIRNVIKKHQSLVRKIGDNRGELYARALGSYRLINKMREGVVDFKVRVQGYPENSMLSGAYASLVPIDDTGISKKLQKDIMERYGSEKGKNMLSQMFANMKGRILMPSNLADAIGRDFDGDPIALIGLSLDELDNAWTQAGVTKTLMDELGYDKGMSQRMALESIDNLIYQQAVIESSVSEITGSYKQIRPTNAMAITMAAQADDLAKKGILEKVNIREGLINNHLNDIMRTGLTEDEAISHIDNLIKNLEKKTKELYLDKEHGPMYIVTGAVDNRSPDERSKSIELDGNEARESRRKVLAKTSHIGSLDKDDLKILSKDYPQELQAIIGRNLTDDENTILTHLKKAEKQDWYDYQQYFRERSVATFAERKLKTPPAYITGEALNYLTESYAHDERFKSMMTILSDKKLTQHALNMKHGKPLILSDMINRLKYMADPDSRDAKAYFQEHYGATIATEKFYKDFAEGNFLIDLPDGTMRDMKRVGFIKSSTESINFNTYETYLNSRQEYLKALSDANAESIQSLGAEYSDNKTRIKDVKKRHIINVDAKMSSWESTIAPDKFKPSTVQNSWMYHGQIVSGAIEENLEMIKNFKKWKVDEYEKNMFTAGERVDLLKRYAKSARSWQNIEGYGLFEDAAIKSLRKFKPPAEGETGLFEVLTGHLNRMDDFIRNRGTGAVAVDNLAKRVIGRAAMAMFEMFPDMQRMDPDNRVTSHMRGAVAENRRVLNDKLSRVSKGSTPFRQGSIFNTMAGKINKITASSIDDTILRSVRKTKVGSILAGMFVGALAGQTYNQVNSGYAVPDLEQTKGLGGEYFEKTSGIMGNEMEAMMSPRPPKVTPNYKSDFANDQAVAIMRNIRAATNRDHKLETYGSNFRGTIVR